LPTSGEGAPYGAAQTTERAGDLAQAASLFNDLLALRSEGAGDRLHFAQALAFPADLILER
jgi:hypothetical protein